jgi:hypothetical protein
VEATVRRSRKRLVRACIATEAVLLDLQAHELSLGEWFAEDLLQPDGVHPIFHPCRVVVGHVSLRFQLGGEVRLGELFAALIL